MAKDARIGFSSAAVGDTTGAAGQSLAIQLMAQEGRKAAGWIDYQSGEYGDLIDLQHAKLGSL